jgi:hypothetical protein
MQGEVFNLSAGSETKKQFNFVHFFLIKNEPKNQEGFRKFLVPIAIGTKTMDVAIAPCSFSLCETHFRWQPHYF